MTPLYAIPEADLRGELVAGTAASNGEAPDGGMLDGRHVLAVGHFDTHTTPGEPCLLRTEGGDIAAFRPADPDLAGLIVLDWDGPDAWYEEDEEVVAHPRDPFHRVHVRAGSRHVRIELDGEVLAESNRPTLLFEPPLPTRFYLPREDVVADLRPSGHRTACAYKGRATYFSVADEDDVVWTYEEPLADAAQLRGLVAFFDERVDVIVDGRRRERLQTPWSRRPPAPA